LTKLVRKFTQAASPELAKRAQLAESYGRLPLSFEVNDGQTDNQVKFLSRGQGYTLFLTSSEAVLATTVQKSVAQGSFTNPRWRTALPGSFHLLLPAEFETTSTILGQVRAPGAQPPPHAVLHMKLVGANLSPKVAGQNELPGRTNYFIGDDPQKWRTNILAYAKVKYADVYPGVDLVYYGNQRQLEYDFVVAPGADPGVIRLRVAGDGIYGGPPGRGEHHEGSHLHIDANGDLVIETHGGKFDFHKPVVYQPAPENYESYRMGRASGRLQMITGKLPHAINRKYIDGHYVLKGEDQVSFKLAAYDVSQPIVIDPVLNYSTYLGGSDFDQGFAIATDRLGNAYVTGETCSVNFPTANAMQPTYHGFCDAFVTKLKPSGSAAVYSTYIGGSGEDAGFGIALDLAGNAYVAGWTDSEDFPTANPIQPTRGKGGGEFGSFFDAFALKLNSTGSKLVYSTYLGGSDFDLGLGIAVDPLGNAYVTGVTESDDFPTAHAIQLTHGGRADAFVTKLNSTGSRLVYSTYLGGSDFERGLGIAADAVGNAYVTGLTHSANFPVVNAIQPTLGGGQFDAFVAKLNSSGSSLIYSTFLGGDGVDLGQGIAADLLGNAYLTGVTCSSNFPTANAIQPTYQGGCDAFVTKLNPRGSILLYSTYLGGSDFDIGSGIAVDLASNAYVVGSTRSINFPTVNAVQPRSGGGFVDAFVLKLERTGSRLAYSTYLGGSNIDQGNGIAVSRGGSAYVTGVTLSSDFPTAHPLPAPNNALQGVTDSFVAKIRTDTLPPVVTVLADPCVLWPPNGRIVSVIVSGTIRDSGSGVDPNTAAFSVVDEYGKLQPSGPVRLRSGGGYFFSVALQAWRRHNDTDGRLYTITVSAKDNDGNPGSGSAVVSVPHDQGH